jgi:hypothetical protein
MFVTLLPQQESASVVESGDSGTQVGVLGGYEIGALPTAAMSSDCVEHALPIGCERGKVGEFRDYVKLFWRCPSGDIDR